MQLSGHDEDLEVFVKSLENAHRELWEWIHCLEEDGFLGVFEGVFERKWEACLEERGSVEETGVEETGSCLGYSKSLGLFKELKSSYSKCCLRGDNKFFFEFYLLGTSMGGSIVSF